MRRIEAFALLVVAGMAVLPRAAAKTDPGATVPATLLLAAADLPGGYAPDAALENADATARTSAYSPLIRLSAFTGYRTAHSAVTHYVALLRRRADAAIFLTREATAVDRTHGAMRLTLASSYGDRSTLAYQQHGTRGEEWVVAIFTDGPYVSVLAVYEGSGEQAAMDVLQRLSGAVDARLRAAAATAPDPTPTPPPRPVPSLRLVSLITTTRSGRLTDTFHPHSPLYWRATWRIGLVRAGQRETLSDTVWQGKKVLYRNGLTDRPYSGDNAAIDHTTLGGLTPGRYSVSVTIALGRLTARATRTFRVVAAPVKRP